LHGFNRMCERCCPLEKSFSVHVHRAVIRCDALLCLPSELLVNSQPTPRSCCVMTISPAPPSSQRQACRDRNFRSWGQYLPRLHVKLKRSHSHLGSIRAGTPILLIFSIERKSSNTVLRVQVVANSALKLPCALTQHVRQVLEVVACGDAKFADKVLGCALKVTVVILGNVVLGAAKVCVRGDGGCTFETCNALVWNHEARSNDCDIPDSRSLACALCAGS
jgi:hypothetical protein